MASRQGVPPASLCSGEAGRRIAHTRRRAKREGPSGSNGRLEAGGGGTSRNYVRERGVPAGNRAQGGVRATPYFAPILAPTRRGRDRLTLPVGLGRGFELGLSVLTIDARSQGSLGMSAMIHGDELDGLLILTSCGAPSRGRPPRRSGFFPWRPARDERSRAIRRGHARQIASLRGAGWVFASSRRM